MAKEFADSSEALQHLSLLRVAKDLFLSQWYRDSTEAFFNGDDAETLRDIAEESRWELEETLRVMQEWADRVEGKRDAPGPQEVARATRHEFLATLLESKQATWEVYEAAALAAPKDLQHRILRLGAMDLEHARRLRVILNRTDGERTAELLGPSESK